MQKFKLRIIVEADFSTPNWGIGRMRPVWLGYSVTLDCGHATKVKRDFESIVIGESKARCYQCGGQK